MQAPRRILSIDGGGVFGLVPATLLETYSPYAIFDAFGGTSIGAAIAAYYACGFAADGLPPLMQAAFPDIFTAPWYRYCWPRSSKYPADGLQKFLSQIFGKRTLGSVQKPLYVFAFDFARKRPKVFSSVSRSDKEILIADAVLASVSAPTYFPPANNLVDGGLWANCPAVALAAGVAKEFNCEVDALSVFSIGTGQPPESPVDMSGSGSWGILSWASRIVSAMLEGGSVRGMEFIASQLPFHAYCRWDKVPLKDGWKMDSTDCLDAVIIQTRLYQADFDAAVSSWLREDAQW